jgi:hypothetical protein
MPALHHTRPGLLARSAATPKDVIARYDALGDPQKK